MRHDHVIDHFLAISQAVDLNLIVHVYPAWTKARYSSRLLAELARVPNVTTFKVGTREMSKYERDIRAIRARKPCLHRPDVPRRVRLGVHGAGR